MLSIVLWSSIIIGGTVAYGALGGEYKQVSKKDTNKKEENRVDNYKETYDYFMDLSLDEQHQYINNNLDLAYYKNDLLYDNKQSTAREVARRADKLGKSFTNRYSRY